MRTTWLRRACLLALLALAPACALTPDTIDVRHVPTSTAAPVAGAQGILVTVTASDERNSNRDRVSVKKNGYGMEMAPIVASNDVVAEVGRAVEASLRGMGFQLGQAREGTVTVQLSRLWNDFKLGMWSSQAAGELAATVTVRAADGRTVFTRLYTVESVVQNVMIMNGENARLALVQVLDLLAQRVGGDAELAQALLALRAAPPPPAARTPARPAPARAGVPAS
jgi:uncharacterized lipoprotein